MGRLMNMMLLLFLFYAAVGCVELEQLEVDVSILKPVGIKKNPVGILFNGSILCGATILRGGVIVTAGHCATKRMAVRFQNPDGFTRIVYITGVLQREFRSVNLSRPEGISAAANYALLTVDDPKTLVNEFSSMVLASESEIIATAFRAARQRSNVQGNFLVYDISQNQHTLRKQPGALAARDLIIPNFFKTNRHFTAIQTSVSKKQAGAPYIVNNKVYGIATDPVPMSSTEKSTRVYSGALVSRPLHFDGLNESNLAH